MGISKRDGICRSLNQRRKRFAIASTGVILKIDQCVVQPGLGAKAHVQKMVSLPKLCRQPPPPNSTEGTKQTQNRNDPGRRLYQRAAVQHTSAAGCGTLCVYIEPGGSAKPIAEKPTHRGFRERIELRTTPPQSSG